MKNRKRIATYVLNAAKMTAVIKNFVNDHLSHEYIFWTKQQYQQQQP